MGSTNNGYDITETVGASALAQFKLVKTPGAAVVSAAVTDDCIGIIQDGADALESEVRIRHSGPTYALAHAAISKGDELSPQAAGRVATHDGTTANPVIGYALEDASAQDDEILIYLYPNKVAGPAA